MSSVSMATKEQTKEQTVGWTSIFPEEQATLQQSLSFMKKLVVVCVSTITYLRSIFPESAYGERRLEDLQLKILKDDGHCASAKQVIGWVKGCLDAVEKKYLRQLIIGILKDPDDPNTLIESYSLRFSYSSSDGPTFTIYRNGREIVTRKPTSKQIKRATMSLLHTLMMLMQTLNPIPDNAYLTMKLLYYDEVTPPDYEPPGFKPAKMDTFLYECEVQNLKVGEVFTPFHQLHVRIKSDKNQFVTEESMPTPSVIDSTAKSEAATEMYYSNDEDGAVPEDDAAIPETQASMQVDNDIKVCCPCAIEKNDDLMVLCEVCNMWQHAVCFKVLKKKDLPEIHICDKCVRDKKIMTSKGTDPSLAVLTESEAMETCLWRRALKACSECQMFSLSGFCERVGVNSSLAITLFNRLQVEGYGEASGSGKINVNKTHVKEHGIAKYFHDAVNKSTPRSLDDFTPKSSKRSINMIGDVAKKSSQEFAMPKSKKTGAKRTSQTCSKKGEENAMVADKMDVLSLETAQLHVNSLSQLTPNANSEPTCSRRLTRQMKRAIDELYCGSQEDNSLKRKKSSDLNAPLII